MKLFLGISLCMLSLGLAAPSMAQSPGNFSTLSTTGTATLGGDVLMCSGRPWIDVRCNGAVGDDSHDDTGAIQTTINSAMTNNWPVHIPAGTYKVTSQLTIDYAGQAEQRLPPDFAGRNDRRPTRSPRVRCSRSSAAGAPPAARPAASTSRKKGRSSSTPIRRVMPWFSASQIFPTRTTRPRSII